MEDRPHSPVAASETRDSTDERPGSMEYKGPHGNWGPHAHAHAHVLLEGTALDRKWAGSI